MPQGIQPDQVWLLCAVILSGVALSIWLEQSYAWAAKVSGPVIALLLAMILSNTNVMPTSAPTYDFISDHVILLAVPLLLFRASLFQIVRTTGPLFLAFHIATLGTVVGALFAGVILNPLLLKSESLTGLTPEICGIMTASYVGGGVNFYAVANSLKASSAITNPLLVADNFVMAGAFFIMLLAAKSKWMRNRFPHPHSVDAVDSRELAAQHWRRKEIALFDIAGSLAVAVVIIALAMSTSLWIKTQFQDLSYIDILSNKFIHITFWSVLVATIAQKPLSKLQGSEEFGAYLLYIFLFVIGLPADLRLVIQDAPLLFVLCTIIAVANLVVTFFLGKLLGFNLEDLILASNASLGGPPTAAAMAVSQGWSRLVLPGLLAGLWGYTIGTPIGLAVTSILRSWLN